MKFIRSNTKLLVDISASDRESVESWKGLREQSLNLEQKSTNCSPFCPDYVCPTILQGVAPGLPLRERYPDTWIERIFTTALPDARELRLGCRVGDRKPYLPTVFGRHSTTSRGRGIGGEGRREREKRQTDRPRTGAALLQRSPQQPVLAAEGGSLSSSSRNVFT